jgi:Protein of unknown function (DUF3047)
MRNELKITIMATCLLGGLFVSGSEPVLSSWREDFSSFSNDALPKNWKVKKHIGTPKTSFEVEKQLHGTTLIVNATKSSGTLITVPKGVDLLKTPILRWRWRAINLPNKADGRIKGKDDQAIAIYIGMNSGMFTKKTLAYRWETETPQNISAKTSYGLGMIKVNWFCLRNKKDKLGTWYTEERNIANDFMQVYGTIPKDFALSIAANSQHTKSSTRAEIEWLEFIPEKPVTQIPVKLLAQTGKK